jgi:phage tail sheath protein FI
MLNLKAPGVYPQELDSGVRSIVGAPTSVALFVGPTPSGIDLLPQRVANFGDFQRLYGGLAQSSFLSYSVLHFFSNGGGEAFVMRVPPDGSKPAQSGLKGDGISERVALVRARSNGACGNGIYLEFDSFGLGVDIAATARPTKFNLTVRDRANGRTERFGGLTTVASNARSPDSVLNDPSTGSGLVSFRLDSAGKAAPAPTGTIVKLPDIQNPGTVVTVPSKIKLQIEVFDASGTPDPTLGFVLDDLEVFKPSERKPLSRLELLNRTVAALNFAIRSDPTSKRKMQDLTIEGTLMEGGDYALLRISAPDGRDYKSRIFDAVVKLSQATTAAISTASNSSSTTGATPGNTADTIVNATTDNPSGNISDTIANDTIANGTTDSTSANTSDTIANAANGATAAGSPVAQPISHTQWLSEYTDSSFGVKARPARLFLGANYPSDLIDSGLVDGRSATDKGADGDASGQPSDDAFLKAVQAIDGRDAFFNTLCLPDLVRSQPSDPRNPFYGSAASIYAEAARICGRKFAFLIVDPPPNITDAGAALGWKTLKIGFQSSFAGAWFPNIRVDDPLVKGAIRSHPPSGAIAGLIARMDAEVGVWQAPAGTDAAINGSYGPSLVLSDDEHGLLNPIGLNCIRQFPIYGTVGFGSRTIDGADMMASDWKYVPVRRTSNYILRTLSDNLRWAVHKPNGEELWSQLRISVNGFMAGLFRQGAFKGTSSRDAYFVRCDASTTSATDIDNGVVNIVIGFAPLKPAEFVVVSLSQIAQPAA